MPQKEREKETKWWVGCPPNYLTKDETEPGAFGAKLKKKIHSQIPKKSISLSG